MLLLRVWVHCPRASNGLLPPRSYLVGYMRWYARSDSGLFLLQTIIPTAFRSQTGNPSVIAGKGRVADDSSRIPNKRQGYADNGVIEFPQMTESHVALCDLQRPTCQTHFTPEIGRASCREREEIADVDVG